MDKRNLCDVARDLFEDETERETDYRNFLAGAAFMHGRLLWLIEEASHHDAGIDPAMLDWIGSDLHWALTHAPDWLTQTRPKPSEGPPGMPRARNVLSDREARDKAYALFGQGWNPDRFEQFWRMFKDNLIPEHTPPEVVQHMKGTYLAGISTAFYDIAKIYVQAANARDPEAFRIYLRDFRRSLERVMQAPADSSKMH